MISLLPGVLYINFQLNFKFIDLENKISKIESDLFKKQILKSNAQIFSEIKSKFKKIENKNFFRVKNEADGIISDFQEEVRMTKDEKKIRKDFYFNSQYWH